MNEETRKRSQLLLARIAFGVSVATVLGATLAASVERWDLFAINTVLFVVNAGLSWFNYRQAA